MTSLLILDMCIFFPSNGCARILGESLVHKLLEAHPLISSVSLLADLSDERSQKTYRDKSRCKSQE
jgi:hypothetical protein